MFKHVYVDLCDTLIKGNTTFMFLDSFFSHNPNNLYWFYRKISTSFFMRIIFKLLFSAKIDLNRRIAIRFLNGYSIDLLREHVKWMLLNGIYKENKELVNVMQCAKNKHIPVTIISASLDFIVEVIASHYSINYYSSKLEYKNGNCQGRIILDLLFDKHIIFNDIEQNNNNYCFISDNIQDIQLLKSCNYGFGVPNLKNEKAFAVNNIKLINYDSLINLIKVNDCERL
ncbi:haloacid dehalogenase-like hydrolase [Enterobacter roggenkampii]|uniref:haloacid dehalogenase-like hydrolase n=1 Tax=Enterobacter roggenkampii TaxID=1812935 RepID=UPI0021D2E76C|nr:HAD family hydrolase [Enterobacter roggenkampii]EKS6941652.1 haloacid dehalogenase-like hydrolase [Enterobacter roggenkampii]MCU6178632.1 haloacid dehalogenase-like hydrolase [Enterobacter roggenkampii]MDK9943089.1 haloacid dehalogenase-like hydrolase [Enterobacter roggenkampii]MDK9947803.1 haloacid dehalogenase-like hydrolase [Enterobacter roggenkampii]